MSIKAVLRIRRDTDAAMADMGKRFATAWRSGRSTAHVFTFESPAALFRILTPKRWDLVERLQALGPSTVRGLARALERDVKRVHEDVAALCEVGLVAKTERGKIQVPFAVIEADFALRGMSGGTHRGAAAAIHRRWPTGGTHRAARPGTDRRST